MASALSTVKCTTLTLLCLSSLVSAQQKPSQGQETASTQGQEKPSAPTPQKGSAQPPSLAIDLTAAARQTWPVDPGTYRIVLYNAIPGVKYTVQSGAAEAAEVPVLVLPAGSAVAGLVDVPPTAAEMKLCKEALSDVRALITAQRESEVPALEQRIRANMASCGEQELKYITAVLGQTVYETGLEVQMPNDARRTLTVARRNLEWNVTLTTLVRGRFQTLFGWVFAPNNDEEFVSESIGNNQFAIRPRTEDSWALTSLPAVFFTWLPTSQAFRDVQHGPTLGLGVTVGSSGSRPAFLGGYIVRWNQNLGVTVGVALYPHRRLDGKYEVDQVIPSNLESSQLNRDSLLANVFFGGVLRFGSDPRKAPPEKPAATTEKPAPAKPGGSS